MSGKLIQLAGIVVDLVHVVDRLPLSGEEVESPYVQVAAGGGFNAMVAAKRMGADVIYGGMLGTGPYADVVATALRNEGVALPAKRIAIDQGSCVVLVEKNGERSFVSHHGAERKIDVAHMQSLAFDNDDWMLLTGYSLYKEESAATFVPWLSSLARGPRLLFDPGPTIAELKEPNLDAGLARADWLSLNAREAHVLTGLAGEKAATALSAGREGAIVRAGADGCWLSLAGQRAVQIAGFQVPTLDSTGAGDCHDGAFIAAMITGYAARDAAMIANAAAALSTTKLGPATSPDLDATQAFLTAKGVRLYPAKNSAKVRERL